MGKLTQQQIAPRLGRAAEHLALAWILRNHDVWATQMADASGIDLLVQRTVDTSRTLRIQVKAVFKIAGRRVVNLKKTNGSRYTPKDVDWVLAVDLESRTFWLLPTHLTSDLGRLSLGRKYSGYAHGWDDAAVEFGGRVK